MLNILMKNYFKKEIDTSAIFNSIGNSQSLLLILLIIPSILIPILNFLSLKNATVLAFSLVSGILILFLVHYICYSLLIKKKKEITFKDYLLVFTFSFLPLLYLQLFYTAITVGLILIDQMYVFSVLPMLTIVFVIVALAHLYFSLEMIGKLFSNMLNIPKMKVEWKWFIIYLISSIVISNLVNVIITNL